MKTGIISDTHGILPAGVFDVFKDVDYIFHAGDIGSEDVIQALEIICPVQAVYGNIDSWPITIHYKDLLISEIDGKKICLVHDIVNPKYFSYQLFKKEIVVDVVISGHTHAAEYQTYRDVLYVNPGSVSKPRGQKLGTVAILDFNESTLNPEIIQINKEK